MRAGVFARLPPVKIARMRLRARVLGSPFSRGSRVGGITAVAWLAASALMSAGAVASGTAESASMLGYTAEDAAEERTLEQRLDAQLRASDLRDWMKRLSAAPNQVGSPHDAENARTIER